MTVEELREEKSMAEKYNGLNIHIGYPDLKPCPFCSGDKLEVRSDDGGISWYIFCNDCGVMCGFALHKGEAIEAWNRRAGHETD